MYPFRYCTVREAKAYANLNATDEDILRRIELWSATINAYTGQWFLPVKLSSVVEATSDELFYIPSMIPIIELSSPFEVVFSRSGGKKYINFPPTALNTDGNSIRQYDNIDVEGYFGNITPLKEKLETTVAMSAAIGATEIILDDDLAVRPGDAVLIGDYVVALVTEVCDDLPSRVIVDPIAYPVVAGESVISFGKPPTDITYALLECIAAKGWGVAEKRNNVFLDNLIRETTDDYSYLLSRNEISSSTTGTGIVAVDRILLRYRPALVMHWV